MRLAHDQHVDWPAVLAELYRLGVARADVAKHIGAGAERIKKWVSIECQPRHDDGERLLTLWSEVSRKPREMAPVVSRHAPRRG
jgi:hypothetical protein